MYSNESMDTDYENNVNNPSMFDDLIQSSETGSSSSETTLQNDYDDEQQSYPSDCESEISSCGNVQKPEFLDNGMIKLDEQDKVHEIIRNKFVSSLCCDGFTTRVETIYRNSHSIFMNKVKHACFCLYSKGMEIKRNGNANVKYVWYGGSKDELNTILSHGFSLIRDNGVYRRGIYLSPIDHIVESIESAVADESGLKHMLLCRVILGNMELVHPGSDQYKPSSEDFDSGIDNFESPKKYIVWDANINTHILPEFVVSFRGCQKRLQTRRVPTSDWMPFATLIKVLIKFLTPNDVKLISKLHSDYNKQKISREKMIRRVRGIAGDKLLKRIIIAYKDKAKASRSIRNSTLD